MLPNLDLNFPRYREFSPKVPVWCVTPERPHGTHRFFDTSPISPSGRYLAVLQLPFEDRQPEPGEKAKVVLVDLQTGKQSVLAETCGWEPQLGANINWGSSDHELFFNDVDVDHWQPFAWKCDPLSGQRTRLEGTLYHASPNGRWLISSNLLTTRKTQAGYGVRVPDHAAPPWKVGPADDDGFWITDTRSGKRRLLISIRSILEHTARSVSPIRFHDTSPPGDPECSEIHGFHSKFNPQGDAVMLSLRWFPALPEPRWDLFTNDFYAVRFAWVTLKIDPQTGEPDLASLRCAVGPEQWQYGGHHATWFPDGRRISMNLRIGGHGTPLRFVQVNADGSQLGVIPGTEKLVGSGHPSLHRDGVHLLSDTYTREGTAFGDGTVPLRWIDLRSGVEECIVRVDTVNASTSDGVLRCDPHPAWHGDWRHITFNAMDKGVRRVYIADLRELLNGSTASCS